MHVLKMQDAMQRKSGEAVTVREARREMVTLGKRSEATPKHAVAVSSKSGLRWHVGHAPRGRYLDVKLADAYDKATRIRR